MSDHTEAGAELVLSERRDGVLVITFNRPDRLNAWTNEMESAYFDLLEEAQADPDVRAIVVTGAGRGFCAGADMDGLREATEAGVDEEHALQTRPRWFPLTVRKPMIAAVNGAAAGLGFVEALYCDLRFAAPEAKLTTSFARRGLIAEHGASWLLPRLVGPSAALDLFLSGRVVQGEEALRMGLVNRVIPGDRLLDEAIAYARDLATYCAPTSMAIMKEQVRQDLELTFLEAEIKADELMAASLARADAVEGVRSYLEGRAPAFEALGAGR